jgi:hypothetical protein
VSTSSRKGYSAEHALELALKACGYPLVYRPRAGAHDDVGDIGGLPVVVSVKNHRELRLAEWIDAAVAMGDREDKLAVVWHKRRAHSSPYEWYVSMDGQTFLNFLRAYDDGRRR